MELNELTAETFRPHIGSTFTVEFLDGAKLDLTLEDVSVLQLRKMIPRLARDTFGIYFAGPKDLAFPQGTYDVHHDVLGTMTLFVVPKGRRADGGFSFEAIFT
jgi:hypothetical protein